MFQVTCPPITPKNSEQVFSVLHPQKIWCLHHLALHSLSQPFELFSLFT